MRKLRPSEFAIMSRWLKQDLNPQISGSRVYTLHHCHLLLECAYMCFNSKKIFSLAHQVLWFLGFLDHPKSNITFMLSIFSEVCINIMLIQILLLNLTKRPSVLEFACFTSTSFISFLKAGYAVSKPDVITLLEQGKEPRMVGRDVTGGKYPGEWSLLRQLEVITVTKTRLVCEEALQGPLQGLQAHRPKLGRKQAFLM